MRRSSSAVVVAKAESGDHERRRRSEAGDTLVEILLTLVVLGLAGIALMTAFATSISASAEHRSLATIDTVLKTASEQAMAQIEDGATPLYESCATVADYQSGNSSVTPALPPVNFSVPSGSTAAVTQVQYWDTTNSPVAPPSPPASLPAFVSAPASTCMADWPNSEQLITITVTFNGTSYTISSVVDDPAARPIPTAGTASQLVFAQSPGSAFGGTAFGIQPIIYVEDSNGNVVTSDFSNTIQLAITPLTPATGGPGTLSNCAWSESYGVITFSGCSIDKVGGGYSLTATDTQPSSTLTATSSSFGVAPGVGAKLTFTTQPGGGTGGVAWAQQPVITILDAGGNRATGDTSTVTLSIGTNPSSGTLSGCSEITTAGVATFSDCKINKVGTGYTLTATDATDSLNTPSAPSSSFNVTLGPAAKLAFTTQPGNGTATFAFTQQPTVTVEDAGGNIATGDTSTVRLAITAGTPAQGGPGTLSCTSNPKAASSGVAAYTGCAITTAGRGYTLTATDGALTSAVSTTFNIAGAATKLAFTIQPGNGTSTSPFTQQPTVTVEDVFGSVVTSDSSTVQLAITAGTPAQGGPGTLNCGPNTRTAAFGVAAYTGCAITGAGRGYTLTATDGALASAVSTTFNIAGAATHLAFTTPPSSTSTGGAAFGTQPVVSVEDSFGSVVTSDSSTVHLAITAGTGSNPGGGTLTCAANQFSAAFGVAAYAACSIDKAGTGYTLTASDGSLTSATSNAIAVSVGPGSQLVFTTSPSATTTAGTTFATQPQVTVEDAGGNVVTSDSSTVSLTISTGTPTSGGPGSLIGCLGTESSGVVSFSGCKVNITGSGYTLTASDGAMTPATSSSFTITVGAASQLAFIAEPGFGVSGSVFITQPFVAVQDAFGNTVTTDTSTVTLAIGTNPGGGTLSCTSTSLSATSGVAGFANCTINLTGTGYTLTATDGALTSTTSSPFNVNPGAATQLAFATQPGGGTGGTAWAQQPVVTVEDANGNVATGDSSTVALTIATNPGGGTLSGCSGVEASGVVTFSGCSIDKTANGYSLLASDGALTTATSSGFNITAGTATKLVFTTQPVGGVSEGTNFATQPKVSVEDAGGNVVTSDTGNVTLAIATYTAGNGGTTSGALGCTATTVAAGAGVATFAGCQITGTAAAGTYTLSATRSGLTTGTSVGVSITAGTATKLVFTTQPVGGVSEGTNFATQPKVSVEDAGGNVVTSDTGNVTLAIATYTAGNGGTTSGALGCTATTVAAGAGVATFAGCQITGTAAAGTYTLSATRSGLTTGTSVGVSITAGTATKLIYTTQPSGGTGGAAWAQQPVVTVEDANNNVVTGDVSPITLVTIDAPGKGALLSCTTNPVTPTAGVSTFAGCKINKAGTYTVIAVDVTDVLQVTSSSVTITIGAATQVAFSQQPSGSSPFNTAWAQQPMVAIEDVGSNVVTGSSTAVTLTDSLGTFSCTINPVTTVSGVATFAGCKNALSESREVLTAMATTGSGLANGTSAAFNDTPGAPTHPLYVSQPTVAANGNLSTFTVGVYDTSANLDTAAAGTVSLSIASGPGGAVLTCNGVTSPSVAVSYGVATFAGCGVNMSSATAYTITATDGALSTTSVTSAPFTFNGTISAPTIAFPTGANPIHPGSHNGTGTFVIIGSNFATGEVTSISSNAIVNSYELIGSGIIVLNVTGSGGNGGTRNVTVTNPDGGTVSVANGFLNG